MGKLVVTLWLDRAKFAYRIQKMGKQLITTNRSHWKSRQVVRSMTSMWRLEDLFRKMNSNDYLSTRPMFHWTDSMIRVHHLVIMLGLQLMTLAYREVCHSEPEEQVSFDELFEELAEVKEYLLFYPVKKGEVHTRIENNSSLDNQILSVLGLEAC